MLPTISGKTKLIGLVQCHVDEGTKRVQKIISTYMCKSTVIGRMVFRIQLVVV